MVAHSSIVAWRSPWTEEPGELWFMELERVDTTEATDNAVSSSVPLQVCSHV